MSKEDDEEHSLDMEYIYYNNHAFHCNVDNVL